MKKYSGFGTGLSATVVEITPLLAEENSLRAFLFPFSFGRIAFSAVKALRLLQVGFQMPGGWRGTATEIDIF